MHKRLWWQTSSRYTCEDAKGSHKKKKKITKRRKKSYRRKPHPFQKNVSKKNDVETKNIRFQFLQNIFLICSVLAID
jgi:hypothetical protein